MISGKYKYEEVADQIRRRVVSGELRPGSRLLASNRMAFIMGCHPHTVRKAFRMLEREGYITAISGSGTFVAKQVCR